MIVRNKKNHLKTVNSTKLYSPENDSDNTKNLYISKYTSKNTSLLNYRTKLTYDDRQHLQFISIDEIRS